MKTVFFLLLLAIPLFAENATNSTNLTDSAFTALSAPLPYEDLITAKISMGLSAIFHNHSAEFSLAAIAIILIFAFLALLRLLKAAWAFLGAFLALLLLVGLYIIGNGVGLI